MATQVKEMPNKELLRAVAEVGKNTLARLVQTDF